VPRIVIVFRTGVVPAILDRAVGFQTKGACAITLRRAVQVQIVRPEAFPPGKLDSISGSQFTCAPLGIVPLRPRADQQQDQSRASGDLLMAISSIHFVVVVAGRITIDVAERLEIDLV
jgi:hypothetical protein